MHCTGLYLNKQLEEGTVQALRLRTCEVHPLGLFVKIWCQPEDMTNDFGRSNVQKLTSLNLMLRTTIMTPVNPQISKFQAGKSCQVGFNVLRRL
jgi:hypothetical protein